MIAIFRSEIDLKGPNRRQSEAPATTTLMQTLFFSLPDPDRAACPRALQSCQNAGRTFSLAIGILL